MNQKRVNLNQKGITLVELLTTMTVVAILASIAVPSFRSATRSSQLSGETNAMIGAYFQARSQAVMTGRPVTVCTSSNGTTCVAGAWQNGWIIFADANGNQTVNPGDAIYSIQPKFSSKDTVTVDSPVTAVTFNREGFATGITQDVTFTFKGPSSMSTTDHCVLLPRMGTAQAELSGTGNCS